LRVVMLNPATRGVPRVPPSRLAAPRSYFLRGEIEKRNGRQGRGDGDGP